MLLNLIKLLIIIITGLDRVQKLFAYKIIVKIKYFYFSIRFWESTDYAVVLFDKADYEGHVNHKLPCNNSALHLSVISMGNQVVTHVLSTSQ